MAASLIDAAFASCDVAPVASQSRTHPDGGPVTRSSPARELAGDRSEVFDQPPLWGLTTGDRRFLAVALAIMAILLVAHGYQEMRRSAFQVRVVRPAGASGSPLRQTAGLISAAAAPEPRLEAPADAPAEARFLVDINSADWQTWMLLDGIGETLARRIVEDRNRRGPFASIEDVARVKGIGPKTLAKMRPHLKVSEPRR